MAVTSVFELEGRISVDNSDAVEKLDSTEQKVNKVGKSFLKGIANVVKWGTAIVGVVTAARVAVLKFASSAINKLDSIDKMSQKIGLSTDAYQKWEYVMGQCGMQIDSMQIGMKTLVSQMQGVAEGTASSKEAFHKLGVSVYDTEGKMKSQEEMFQEVILALSKMEEGVERANLATTLFGRSGTELAPLLNQGSEAIEGLIANTEKLGLIIENDTVLAGVKLGDTFDDIKRAMSAMTTNFKSSLFPALQQMADKIIALLPTIKGMFDKLAPVVSQMLEGMVAPTIELFSSLMDTLLGLFEGILPVLSELTNQILPVFASLLKSITPLISNLAQAVLPVLTKILEKVMPIITELIERVIPYLATLLERIMPIIEIIVNQILPILLDKFVELAPYLFDLIDTILPILIELVDALLPCIQPILEILVALLDPLLQLTQFVLPILTATIRGIGGLLAKYIAPILRVLVQLIGGAFSEALKGIATIMQGVGAVFTNVWNGIVAMWNKAVSFFQGIWNGIKNVFSGVGEFFHDLFSKLWNGIKSMINAVIYGLNKMIEAPINLLNKGIGLLKKINLFGWKPFDFLGEIPVPQIPMLAKGGVLKKGQVGYLEGDGDEAVVPLSQNTEWMNTVAERLNSLQAEEWRTRTEKVESTTVQTTFESSNSEQVLLAILDAVQKLDNHLQDKFFDAISSLKLQINDREFARLVKKNA